MQRRDTHKVAEDVQELDKVANHGALHRAFGVAKHHIVAAEATWLMQVFEGGMRKFRAGGPGI